MKKEKKKLKLFQVQFLPDAGYSIPQKKKKKGKYEILASFLEKLGRDKLKKR